MIKPVLTTLWKITKWFGLTLTVFVVGVVVYTLISPVFGGKADAASKEKFAQSKQYDGSKFNNFQPVSISTRNENSPSYWEMAKGLLSPAKDKNPTQPLPTKPVQANSMSDGDFIWMGHSTILFKTAGKTIITDPVFHTGAPVSFAVQPFPMTNAPKMADLPEMDAVLISHDHYDHLDFKAIQKLDSKVKHFYVPLGIKAHLQRWGVADNKVTELDWYESVALGDVTLTLTPSRHFSGRGLFDRFKTLWSSWVVKSPDLSVYFSGDGGYSPEFKTIGEKFGPFDIAFMEDGAYNPDWAEIHMTPEDSAKAAMDLGAKALLPIHWAKFDLASHPWTEPANRISKAVAVQNDTLVANGKQPMTLTTPMIGETFTLDNLPTSRWWDGVK